jgi:SAM-dependent methyltransferase
MEESSTKVKSSSAAALESYEELGARMEEHDPRDQYTYMYSKFRSDYTLMERVGVTGKSVLNVGCSFPVDELYYARKVASWTAIDLSPQSVDGAERILRRELHPDLAAKFRFQLADACDLPFEDGTFDVTLSMSTLDQMPPESHQKAVDEMARTTKPGGHVIVTVANKWNPPYAAGIRKMMREKTLHYGYAYLFTPVELRKIGERAGLSPAFFASSISPPDVWLPGYPAVVRVPAGLEFKLHRAAGYLGRRVGYAFEKPIR